MLDPSYTQQMAGGGPSSGGGGKRGLLPALSKQVLSVSSWFRIPEQVHARIRGRVDTTAIAAGMPNSITINKTTTGHEGVRAAEPGHGLLPEPPTAHTTRPLQAQEGGPDLLARRGPLSVDAALPGALARVRQGRACGVPPAAVAGAV